MSNQTKTAQAEKPEPAPKKAAAPVSDPSTVAGLLDIGFNGKAFCGDQDVKLGVEKVVNGLERATSSPANLDKFAFQAMLQEIESLMAGYAQTVVDPNHPMVGDESTLTATDARDFCGALEKSQSATFSAEAKSKMAACPDVIRLLRHRSEKQQVKIINSAWLDKLIGWVVQYGPIIAQFLMLFLPLL